MSMKLPSMLSLVKVSAGEKSRTLRSCLWTGFMVSKMFVYQSLKLSIRRRPFAKLVALSMKRPP